MNTGMRNPSGSREGVALIICLGLLAIMTLLAVTFSISMRVERMAARNFADQVRSKHLIQAAFARAMMDIDDKMRQRVYPVSDAWGSGMPSNKVLLITGAVTNFIPGGDLLAQATAVKPYWVSDMPYSQIAYVVINASGLVDESTLGTNQRQWSVDTREIDFTNAPDFSPAPGRTNFVGERDSYVRYETIDEMKALSQYLSGAGAVSNFNTFSYDPGRDKVFLKVPAASAGSSWWKQIDTTRPPKYLGTRDAESYLHDKFNINSIVNYTNLWGKVQTGNDYWNDVNFRNNYYTPLVDMLTMANLGPSQNERPDDIAWNIINYLDPSRIPQNAEVNPWVHTTDGKPIPLVNEILVFTTNMPGTVVIIPPVRPGNPPTMVTNSAGPGYVVGAEFWYPYVPSNIVAADNFSAQILVFKSNDQATPSANLANSAALWTNVTVPILNMAYGSNTEFFTFYINNPPIIFPPPAGGSTNQDLGTTDPVTHKVNEFWLDVRVLKKNDLGITIPIDDAPGYSPPDARWLFEVKDPIDYSINDPRSNGTIAYWTSVTPQGGPGVGINGQGIKLTGTTGQPNTMGTTNSNCYVLNQKNGGNTGAGVPIYAQNGAMRNIAELGHIFRSNLNAKFADPNLWFWRTISLMRADEGAMLLDMMATHDSRPPTNGVFSANSRQTNAWKIVFNNVSIGIPNVFGAGPYPIQDGDVLGVIYQKTINPSCVSFYDMFNTDTSDSGGGGPLADAFRYCAPNHANNEIYKDGTFASICEMLSFRQNIFTIVMAAQALGPSGGIVSERRAIATVYRDAYTGRHFTRNFRWLDQ